MVHSEIVPVDMQVDTNCSHQREVKVKPPVFCLLANNYSSMTYYTNTNTNTAKRSNFIRVCMEKTVKMNYL